MVRVLTSMRALGGRLWFRRPGIVLASCLILVFAVVTAAYFTIWDWLADGSYQAAAADADRLDPGWRLDQLLARRAKVPDEVNSVLRVNSIIDRMPGGWPGIKHYDSSFVSDGGTPEIRLKKPRIVDLQAVYEPVAGVASQARALSDYPRGNLVGPRPRVERHEQVGGMNAYVDVHFPYGDEVCRVMFLLWLDAKLSIEAGDLETAMVDVRAMINAGRSIGDYPGPTAQSTRAGACRGAIPCLETTLAQGEVRASSLAALQSLLEDESRQPHVAVALRGNRAITDDLLQQIHAGKLGLNAIPGFLDYPFFMRSLSGRGNLREIQATLLRFNSRAVEAGEQPEAVRIDAMKALTGEWVGKARNWGFLEGFTHVPERLLLGLGAGAPTWFAIDQAFMRTAIAALAAERYRRERGRWPESLDQLVPSQLAAVPSDPLAAGPLRIRRFPDGLVIYSVGFDRRDDGGKIDWQVRGRTYSDLGFRLWDVDARRRPASESSPAEPSAGDSASKPDPGQASH